MSHSSSLSLSVHFLCLSKANICYPVQVFSLSLTKLVLTQAQFTACTTRGNYTEDVYREVPIKNARTSVTLSSPNFPKPYPQNIQCTWRIVAPLGYQVKLTFLEFHLQESYLDSGCHDYVSVRDGELEFKKAKEIRKRCGSSKPPTVCSSGSVLWMRFVTDKKVEEKGFTIKVLPVSGSTSKRYIAIGVLVSLLLIIIVTIILCRNRFKRHETEVPKVRQYQELDLPTDVEPEQTQPSNEGLEIAEVDLWSSECKRTEQDKGSEGGLHMPTTRNSVASGYCSLSEEGDAFDFKSNRTFSRISSKKTARNEQEELEYTELLTVV